MTGDTRWLDADEMAAWLAFVSTAGPTLAALDADLRPHGLTLGDYEVLVNLTEAPGQALRMCDLAERLRLTPSGLTRRLDGLVRAGLVERVPSTADRRVINAQLTPSGRARLVAAAPDHVASVRNHLIDHISRDDLGTVSRVFAAVREARESRCPHS